MVAGGGNYLGPSKVQGFSIYHYSSFPAVAPNEDNSGEVHGEVYEVEDIRPLDRLEGYDEGREATFYNRKLVKTDFGDAWIYFMEKKQVKGCQKISSGKWEGRYAY